MRKIVIITALQTFLMLPVWAGVTLDTMVHQVLFVHNQGYSDLYICFNDHTCSPLADMIPIHAGEHKLLYVDVIAQRPIKTYYLNLSNNQYQASYQMVFDAGTHKVILIRAGHVVDTINYEPLQEAAPYILVNDTLDIHFYHEPDPDQTAHRPCRMPRRLKKLPPLYQGGDKKCPRIKDRPKNIMQQTAV
jgi:hypothetical protein